MKQETKKNIKNTFIYIGILTFIKVLRLMNRKQSIAFMRYIGRIAFIFARHERKNTIKHLSMAYANEKSSEEIHALGKQVFLNIAACAADAVRLPVLVADGTIDTILDVEDFDKFERYVAKGNGVILMTGHYGNWELLGTWLVRNGINLKVVAKKSYDPRLDKLIVDYRNEAGYANTARGNAVKSVVKGLLNGAVYGLLFDLDTKVKGVFVNFFGRPAHTATIPVVLSKQLGSPVVPVFIKLNKDFTYKIMCFDALEFVDTGDDDKDIVTNTQICSDFYEKMIRRYPEQWIWMHKRWKKQPQGKIPVV